MVRGWHDELKQLFRRYVEMKLAQQVLDFDDLLLYWHALMQDPALARDVVPQFDHVLVDEYQDTNTLQAEILLALKPPAPAFAWSGTTRNRSIRFARRLSRTSSSFPALHPAAAVITLEENYRSTQPILDTAECADRRSVAAISEAAAIEPGRPATGRATSRCSTTSRRPNTSSNAFSRRASRACCCAARRCFSAAHTTATCWRSSSCGATSLT